VVESFEENMPPVLKLSILERPPEEADGMVLVTKARSPEGAPVVLKVVGGKSSMLTEELESENSEPPPEAKLVSLLLFMPLTGLSMHLVIIERPQRIFA
jgi:hypothetical protein